MGCGWRCYAWKGLSWLEYKSCVVTARAGDLHRQESVRFRVDIFKCLPYTRWFVGGLAGETVLDRGFPLTPEQRTKERGFGERPKWGACPAKPLEALRK